MAKEITAGILLKLKDQFSPKIKGAAGSFTGFGDKAVAAADKINKAFSGVAGTLGTLGVTLGAMSLFKASVDYEDSLIRIGTNAGYTAAQTNEARRELLRIAAAAKISDAEMKAFAATLGDNSLGYEDMMQSAEFAAQAIQGLGLGGEEVGQLYSVFRNRGADIDTFKAKLNNLAEIDDRLQGMSVPEFTRYLPQLMETSDTAADNVEDLYLAILTLNNGATKTKAIQQYTAAMEDFANVETREALRGFLGFDTKKENGELKSFSEIMSVLVSKGNEIGNFEVLQKAFHLSDATMRAMKQYNNHYQETIDKVGELGDTSDAISRRAEANSRSLKSALTGLQNEILKQSDAALIKPIEKLADLLNKHPDGLEKAITGAKWALIGLAGVRLTAGVVSFLANLRGLRRGGPIVPQIGGLGGGASPLPVFVTNMRGGGLGVSRRGRGAGGDYRVPGRRTPDAGVPETGGKTPQGRPPLATGKQMARGGAAAGLFAAAFEIPEMLSELNDIKQNEDLTDREKSKAKGGAIGDASGSIVGAAAGGAAGIAAGAAVGAAVGSVVPVLGTAVGALVGMGIGAAGLWLGGAAGRAIGEGIGDAVGAEQERSGAEPTGIPRTGLVSRRGRNRFVGNYIDAVPERVREEVRSVERVPQSASPVTVDGEIRLQSELLINDEGYRVRSRVARNTTPYKFETGHAQEARVVR